MCQHFSGHQVTRLFAEFSNLRVTQLKNFQLHDTIIFTKNRL